MSSAGRIVAVASCLVLVTCAVAVRGAPDATPRLAGSEAFRSVQEAIRQAISARRPGGDGLAPEPIREAIGALVGTVPEYAGKGFWRATLHILGIPGGRAPRTGPVDAMTGKALAPDVKWVVLGAGRPETDDHALLLADGDLTLTTLAHAVVITSGRVSVTEVRESVVIALGGISVTSASDCALLSDGEVSAATMEGCSVWSAQVGRAHGRGHSLVLQAVGPGLKFVPGDASPPAALPRAPGDCPDDDDLVTASSILVITGRHRPELPVDVMLHVLARGDEADWHVKVPGVEKKGHLSRDATTRFVSLLNAWRILECAEHGRHASEPHYTIHARIGRVSTTCCWAGAYPGPYWAAILHGPFQEILGADYKTLEPRIRFER